MFISRNAKFLENSFGNDDLKTNEDSDKHLQNEQIPHEANNHNITWDNEVQDETAPVRDVLPEQAIPRRSQRLKSTP